MNRRFTHRFQYKQIIYFSGSFIITGVTLLTLTFLAQHSLAQTQLWGAAPMGGDQFGTIFSIQPGATSLSNLLNIPGENPGSTPVYTQLIAATNGKLYGMTQNGGTYNAGVIFEYNPSTDTYTKKYNFNDINGSFPTGSLMQATNGKLYGMTSKGGTSGGGVLFEFDPTSGIYTKKIDLTSSIGQRPYGSLIQASNGMLYGMTNLGGTGQGVIFQYDIISNTYTKKFSFSTTSGYGPYGSLVQASNGKLYGMTNSGGTGDGGTLFDYDPVTTVYTKRFEFSTVSISNGYGPYGSLVQASNGKLYGMTKSGGSATSNGVIFEFNPTSNSYAKKVDLSNTNGTQPYGTLFMASNGLLYGITSAKGDDGRGTIFEYAAGTSTYTDKYNFSVADGSSQSSFVQATNGKLYGLSSSAIFEYNYTTESYVIKKVFSNALKGSNPYGLVLANNGNLYGTTQSGGDNGYGVIYELDRSTSTFLKKIDLYSIDGSSPGASLMQASNGLMYGTTVGGGANGSGVIFEYNPVTNACTKKIDLVSENGNIIYDRLVQAGNNKLYGVTYSGGVNNAGVLFEYDIISNTYTKKIDFSSSKGTNPYSTLIKATNGKLYGTTTAGGNNNLGVLFEYDVSTNTYTKKIDFSSTTGSSPIGGLMQASDGKIYGTTTAGGINGAGVIFQYDPSTAAYVMKINLTVAAGYYVLAPMIQSVNGKLYGVTEVGGLNGAGTIFEYDAASNTYTKMFDFNSLNGLSPSDPLIETCDAPSTFYADSDGDGFGNVSINVTGCYKPGGYVTDSTDCNDANASINPAAAEICSNAIDDNCNGQQDEGCVPANLNLKLFIEGYYAGGGKMRPVLMNEGHGVSTDKVDTITVELHRSVFPFDRITFFKGVLLTNGHIVCPFPASVSGSRFYIVVKSRNTLETWSAVPQLFSAHGSFDFTSGIGQAYPDINNTNPQMHQVEPGVWAIYSGDVNQDQSIDGGDFNKTEPDVTNAAFGYFATDVNGDGPVDGSDFNLLEQNVGLGLFVAHP